MVSTLGGLGGDALHGNNGSDLLISGYTSHDGNDGALLAIHKEWASANDYAARAGSISGENPLADRLNGDWFLAKEETVFDDDSVDRLLGGGDLDWLFFDLHEDLTPGLKKTERGN